MHLCIDARMYQASGIGTYLQNLLPALEDTFELTLLGRSSELEEINGRIYHSNTPIYSVTELLRLPLLIPACDVFWSPHYNVPVMSIRANKRLVTIHDVFHLAHIRTLSVKQRYYAKIMMRSATHISDHIITVSEFSKAEIVKYTRANPEKVTVIPNGVDLQRFHPNYSSADKERVKGKYQLPDSFVLFVGNVKPHKNLISLMKAYETVARDIPQQLVIVGKKEGFITSDTLISDKIQGSKILPERVLFTGFVANEDLPIIYNLADLFVFPSLYEGFGLPPLEAMACGCLTLTSNRASMPEICGDATTYFDPENQGELSEKIFELLNYNTPDRERTIQRGIAKATDYAWEVSIKKHVKVLNTLG